MDQSYFEKRKAVYRSQKYSQLLNTITNQQGVEPVVSNFKNFLTTNAEILVLAAAIGLTKGLKAKVESKGRMEVPMSAFESGKLFSQNLVYYMALIVWLYKKDDDIVRPENDEELIAIFEELAEGGLSYLNNEQNKPGNNDLTAKKILEELLITSFRNLKNKN